MAGAVTLRRRSRVLTLVLIALVVLLLRRAWRSSIAPEVPLETAQLIDLPEVGRDVGEDGRLAVKEGEPHPIPALMARAREQWEDLRARQSTTFAEAVAEYERRYGRRPPKGFDQWSVARVHGLC